MTHEFEVREEITLEATPDQVWAAIATGPGINSWFMGSNEVDGGEGGRTRMSMFGETSGATVTAWEPSRHFAYRSDPAPDGTFMAFEYLIEGRDGGSTVLRFAHTGLLGDDWEAEYAGLSVGDGMYLRKLAVYVKHFAGRTSTYSMFVPGPQVADGEKVWAAFSAAVGLGGDVTNGDVSNGDVADGRPARLTVADLPPVEGVVEFSHRPAFLGMRTPDAMYMLIRGLHGMVFATGHSFSATADHQGIERAWQAWMATTFG